MLYRTHIRGLGKLTIVACGIAFTNAWGMRIAPMSGEWMVTATDHYQLTIANDSERTTPVKIYAMTRAQDADGKEIRTPAEDLVVFPRQLLLKPNEQRNVRISLKKKAVPPVEAAYRLIVEEVPTKDNSTPGSGVRFTMRMVAAMYILPKNPRTQIEFINATRNADGFSITLKNSGNTHVFLAKPTFKFTQSGTVQSLEDPDMLKPFSMTNMLAGTTHSMKWTWPANAPRPSIDLGKGYRVDLEWDCTFCEKTRQHIDTNLP